MEEKLWSCLYKKLNTNQANFGRKNVESFLALENVDKLNQIFNFSRTKGPTECVLHTMCVTHIQMYMFLNFSAIFL